MVMIYNFGFLCIGVKCEFKFGFECYWKGELLCDELKVFGVELCWCYWYDQCDFDFVLIGDFVFYDQVFDMSFMFGNLLKCVQDFYGDVFDNVFCVVCGWLVQLVEVYGVCCGGVVVGEMMKWFDMNYYYIVLEFYVDMNFLFDLLCLLQ